MRTAALLATLAAAALAGDTWGEQVDRAFVRALENCGEGCKGGGYGISVSRKLKGGGREPTERFDDVRAALQYAKREDERFCGVVFALVPRGEGEMGYGSFGC